MQELVRSIFSDLRIYRDKDFKNSQKNGKIWINKVSVWY